MSNNQNAILMKYSGHVATKPFSNGETIYNDFEQPDFSKLQDMALHKIDDKWILDIFLKDGSIHYIKYPFRTSEKEIKEYFNPLINDFESYNGKRLNEAI